MNGMAPAGAEDNGGCRPHKSVCFVQEGGIKGHDGKGNFQNGKERFDYHTIDVEVFIIDHVNQSAATMITVTVDAMATLIVVMLFKSP